MPLCRIPPYFYSSSTFGSIFVFEIPSFMVISPKYILRNPHNLLGLVIISKDSSLPRVYQKNPWRSPETFANIGFETSCVSWFRRKGWREMGTSEGKCGESPTRSKTIQINLLESLFRWSGLAKKISTYITSCVCGCLWHISPFSEPKTTTVWG